MHVKSLATALAIAVAMMSAAAAAAAAAAASGAAAETSHVSAVPSYQDPLTHSPECGSDARLRSACALVGTFFRAVNARDFQRACSLLGRWLRSPWHGLTCETSLDGMVLEPVPWGILGARKAGTGVNVLLVVGQPELERFWMRRHVAFVADEHGRLRILRTRLVS